MANGVDDGAFGLEDRLTGVDFRGTDVGHIWAARVEFGCALGGWKGNEQTY